MPSVRLVNGLRVRVVCAMSQEDDIGVFGLGQRLADLMTVKVKLSMARRLL